VARALIRRAFRTEQTKIDHCHHVAPGVSARITEYAQLLQWDISDAGLLFKLPAGCFLG
jgi:hypothetical protein